MTLNDRLPWWLAAVVFVFGAFTVFHFYSGRRKGKSWSEIARTLFLQGRWDIDPDLWVSDDAKRAARFKSWSYGLLIGGVVVIGLFVAWVHWRYP